MLKQVQHDRAIDFNKNNMNKTELIEKIAGSVNTPESEQKFFFEILLKRCAEILETGNSLSVSRLGKFEFRKSFNENENNLIVFITNDNEELHFDIPQKENENLPIDSYFSISIGKPVIPLKGSPENECFVPRSEDEMRRLLELKVEKFIDEGSKIEINTEEQESSDIADIQFSFLNWKKTSNTDEEIKRIEQGLSESTASEVIDNEENENKIKESIESESLLKDETEKVEEELYETFVEKSEETKINEGIKEELIDSSETESGNEELISEEPNDKEELFETTEEWVDDLMIQSKKTDEKIPEETKITQYEFNEVFGLEDKEEKILSNITERETINADDDTSAINEAFKYAEDRKARIESYRGKSYKGIIFASVIILITAGVIYFSYYSGEETPVTLKNSEQKEFKTIVKRSFDIPVTYPYKSEMFAGIYDAINDDILKPAVTSERGSDISGNSNSKVPEIKPMLPSKRIKDFIYQYDDGTFAVQLSSWKSKSVAISEVQKLLDKSFNAFIEETGLSGKTYYRVRVGGFNSLKEAEDFSKK